MALLRLAIAVVVLVLGALGVLMGGVVTWSALREGEITSFYAAAGGPTQRSTVARAREPDAFWRQFALVGLAPLLLGGIAAVGAWRALRS